MRAADNYLFLLSAVVIIGLALTANVYYLKEYFRVIFVNERGIEKKGLFRKTFIDWSDVIEIKEQCRLGFCRLTIKSKSGREIRITNNIGNYSALVKSVNEACRKTEASSPTSQAQNVQ